MTRGVVCFILYNFAANIALRSQLFNNLYPRSSPLISCTKSVPLFHATQAIVTFYSIHCYFLADDTDDSLLTKISEKYLCSLLRVQAQFPGMWYPHAEDACFARSIVD